MNGVGVSVDELSAATMEVAKHMTNGIIGVRNMKVEHKMSEPVTIDLELVAYPGYDATHLINEKWGELFPGNSIIKCRHCGQWGARKCACKYCGAPIE
jgi:hypothetical protein